MGIFRNGDIYFGNDKISPESLGDKIHERLRAQGGERKVYIRADGRAQ